MSGPNQNDKRSKEEDLDIVRRAILMSQYRPLGEQIVNAEVKKKVEREHVDEASEKLAKQFEKGYQTLIEDVKTNAVEGFYSKDENNKPIPVEAFEIVQDNLKAIKKMIAGGAISENAIGDICSFSTDVQLLFYEKGIYFYEQALYEKSIDIFVFLTTLNPHVQSFWIGLALSYEKNLNFTQAIECLEAAIECEPNDFNPYYGLLRCSEAIKDFSKLEELLDAAKDNEAVKGEAEDLIEYLKDKTPK